MTVLFWLLAAVLAAAGLALLLPPLVRAAPPPRPERRAAALAAYRERLEEIESEAGAEGETPRGGRDETAGGGEPARERSDAARALLRDLESDDPTGGKRRSPERARPRPAAAVVLGIAFPALAAGLYTWLGEPRALAPPAGRTEAQAADAADAEIERLVAEAEAIARARGNRLEGEPARLLERALALAPRHRKALWLAAVAALHEDRAGDARDRLERVRALAPLDEEEARIFERLMAQAKARALEP